jgi:hypothetical protein
MRDAWASFRVRTELLMLESTAAHAGCAMACAFGSSAEFEAAVIREKLDVGAYGHKRRRRYVLAVAVATACLLTAVLWMLA